MSFELMFSAVFQFVSSCCPDAVRVAAQNSGKAFSRTFCMGAVTVLHSKMFMFRIIEPENKRRYPYNLIKVSSLSALLQRCIS